MKNPLNKFRNLVAKTLTDQGYMQVFLWIVLIVAVVLILK